MTVPLHTVQLYSGRISVSSAVTLYTVPSGYRAVLKAGNIWNQAGSAKTWIVVVDGGFIVMAKSVPSGAVSGNPYQWSGWIPLNAGQVLTWPGAAGVTWDVVLGGYLYPITL